MDTQTTVVIFAILGSVWANNRCSSGYWYLIHKRLRLRDAEQVKRSTQVKEDVSKTNPNLPYFL